MQNNPIIYGAYGYTGSLIVHEAVKQGFKPLLAGRNEKKLKSIAKEYSLPYKAAAVNYSEIKALLKNAPLIINCAGPFAHTAKIIAETCLETNTHYIDITGEYQVFELLRAYDEEAKRKNIILMPGVGFDVVPSDCLALHLKNRMSDSVKLELAIASVNGGISKGTSKTMVEGLGFNSVARYNGKLINVNKTKVQSINFGVFEKPCVLISWGDVSSAFVTTGIPDIEVYACAPPYAVEFIKAISPLLVRIKGILKKGISLFFKNPSKSQRDKSVTYIFGRVTDNTGKTLSNVLKTLNGYSVTAVTATAIASKILSDNYKPGFQTPALCYGEELIEEFNWQLLNERASR